MAELFRMRIVSKRQVTLPQRLLDVLGLGINDELQIEFNSQENVRLIPVTKVRSDLFTPKITALLKQRERELNLKSAIEIKDARQLPEKIRKEKSFPHEKRVSL